MNAYRPGGDYDVWSRFLRSQGVAFEEHVPPRNVDPEEFLNTPTLVIRQGDGDAPAPGWNGDREFEISIQFDADGKFLDIGVYPDGGEERARQNKLAVQ